MIKFRVTKWCIDHLFRLSIDAVTRWWTTCEHSSTPIWHTYPNAKQLKTLWYVQSSYKMWVKTLNHEKIVICDGAIHLSSVNLRPWFMINIRFKYVLIVFDEIKNHKNMVHQVWTKSENIFSGRGSRRLPVRLKKWSLYKFKENEVRWYPKQVYMFNKLWEVYKREKNYCITFHVDV